VYPPSRFQQWGSLAAERPELAGRGSAMLVRHGVAYLATVSKLGRPRVTPVSAVFDGDSLFVSLIRSTPKCHELQANPFFHLHALPGVREEEFSVRGRARIVVDRDEVARVRHAHKVSRVVCGEDDVFFELLVDHVDFASFSTAADGSLTPVRDRWAPGDGLPSASLRPKERRGEVNER
jgi:hypothetical protein